MKNFRDISTWIASGETWWRSLWLYHQVPNQELLKLTTNSIFVYLTLVIIKNTKQNVYLINICFNFKGKLLLLQSQVFIFNLKRKLDSNYFFVLAIKLFHIARPRIDIWNQLLRYFVLICYNLRWKNVLDLSVKAS